MANYVKNSELKKAIMESKSQNALTREAIDMLMLMATRYGDKLSYNNEDDRQDCIAFAIMDCFLYWERYDPEKSDNAFAYYTQIIKNGYSKAWRRLYHACPKSKKISISNNNIYNI